MKVDMPERKGLKVSALPLRGGASASPDLAIKPVLSGVSEHSFITHIPEYTDRYTPKRKLPGKLEKGRRKGGGGGASTSKSS